MLGDRATPRIQDLGLSSMTELTGNGNNPSQESIGKTHLGFMLGSLVFLFFFYATTFTSLMQSWESDPNYSHGWLILPVSLGLVWSRYRHGLPRGKSRIALGTAEILAGGLLHLWTQVAPWHVVDFLGLFLIVRGLAHVWGGRPAAHAAAFPTAFLFFMFPLPVQWTGAAAVWLQDMVSRISAPLINVFWACHCRGNELLIAGLEERVTIAPECSGLRQIIAFLALAALLAFLGRMSLVRGGVLFLLAVPIAIMANVARVLLMVAGARYLGTSWLSSWLHDVPALLTLPLGLVLTLLCSRWLSPRTEQTAASKVDSPAINPPSRLSLFAPLVMCALLALGGQWLLTRHLQESEHCGYAVLSRPLAHMPMLFTRSEGVWEGSDSKRRELLAEKLPFADEFISRDFVRNGETTVNLYAVYSAAGKDREHHPEICVRDVGGATEVTSMRREVPLDASQTRRVMRFQFRTGPDRVLTVYYWHYTFPFADSTARLSYLQALHRELRQRPPSVTVQVTCHGQGAHVTQVEKELLPAVDEALRANLPVGVRLGSDRLPIRFLGDR